MIKVYENFLPNDIANLLHNQILDTPEEKWETAYVLKGSAKSYIDKSLRNTTDLDAELNESLREGRFTYRFRRDIYHRPCDCYMCEFKKNDLDRIKRHIEAEFDYGELKLHHMFFSVYRAGDFLTSHSDVNMGVVAFVLNLSKNWKPEWGGMLHAEGQYFVPKFNSLVLMDLGDNGIRHFVSEVSPRILQPRIAISGWFQKSK